MINQYFKTLLACVHFKRTIIKSQRGIHWALSFFLILSLCACILIKYTTHKLHIKLEFFLISWSGERTQGDLAMLSISFIPEQFPRPLRDSKHTLHLLISEICGRLQVVEHYRMRPALVLTLMSPNSLPVICQDRSADTGQWTNSTNAVLIK